VPGPYPADVIQPHLAGINSDGRGFTGARTDDLGVGLPPGRRVKLKKTSFPATARHTHPRASVALTRAACAVRAAAIRDVRALLIRRMAAWVFLR
jgi:hypothetical protein